MGEPSEDEPAASIERLRSLTSGILSASKSNPPSPSVVRPPPRDLGGLPFQELETSAGTVWMRIRRLSESDLHGAVPLALAFHPNARQLSLLAKEPASANADFTKALYLDIETVGLRGSGTVAFLIGIARLERGEVLLEQLLLCDVAGEAAMLAFLGERLRSSEVLVTFNGRMFDVPVLVSRKHGVLQELFARLPHLDLLQVARRVHRGDVENCRLSSIERSVLSFEREDDVLSAQVGACYRHFVTTGETDPLRAVVRHNEWDLLSMVALVGVYGEPLDSGRLRPEALVKVARTFRSSGALSEAAAASEQAVVRGAREGRKVRGEIAKARGDRVVALEEFEAVLVEYDDPSVRLEVAKLLEHFAKQPRGALEVVSQGTTEGPPAAERRMARLRAKVERTRPSGDGD